MKIFKILAIILINILLLLVFIIPVELYYVYKWQGHETENFKSIIKSVYKEKKLNINFENYKNNILHTISVDKYFDMLYSKEYVNGTLTYGFRPDENINSDKKPVVFMGCSYTWGDNIDEDETVSAQFAKLTNRPTYNRGGRGWGLAQYLYQVRRDDFYTQFKEEPEYLLYTYIINHNNRLDKFKIQPCLIDFQPKYNRVKMHLVEQKPKFYDRLYSVQNFQYNYHCNKNKVDSELVKLYFTEARDAIREHWKNTKLVILAYPMKRGSMSEELCQELSKEGYTVLDLKKLVDVDLTDDKYRSDGWHPSAEAWQIILPKVIEKLNIYLL